MAFFHVFLHVLFCLRRLRVNFSDFAITITHFKLRILPQLINILFIEFLLKCFNKPVDRVFGIIVVVLLNQLDAVVKQLMSPKDRLTSLPCTVIFILWVYYLRGGLLYFLLALQFTSGRLTLHHVFTAHANARFIFRIQVYELSNEDLFLFILSLVIKLLHQALIPGVLRIIGLAGQFFTHILPPTFFGLTLLTANAAPILRRYYYSANWGIFDTIICWSLGEPPGLRFAWTYRHKLFLSIGSISIKF